MEHSPPPGAHYQLLETIARGGQSSTILLTIGYIDNNEMLY